MRLPSYALVSAFLDAFGQGQFDLAASYLDEDVEMFPSPYWAPVGTVYRGESGWRSLVQFIRTQRAPLRFAVELESIGDHVITTGTGWREVGPGEREDVREFVWLFTVRPGGIGRIEWFHHERDARAAVQSASKHERSDAFDAAPTPMILLDDDGRIVHINRAMASLAGLPPGSHSGRRLTDLLEIPRESRFSRREHDGDQIERTLVAADGSKRRVEIRAARNYIPGRHVLVVVARQEEAVSSPRLTEREREIFALLALGLTGPEVARRLGISANTVRTHVANGMESLGARTRAHAVAEALAHGELDFKRLPDPAESAWPDVAAPRD